MASAKVENGMVALPKVVRDALAICDGEQIEFIIRDGSVEMVSKTVDFRSLYGSIKTNRRSVTVEQMNEDIKQQVAENFEKSLRDDSE
ncbi:hypothetical protein K8I61_04390 [bacterium]|nr:hypothetical protein [bacterium]